MPSSIAPSREPCIPSQERETYVQLMQRIDRSVIARLEQYPPDLPCPPGIMAGHAGAILYLFHRAAFLDDEALYDQALSFLDRLLDDLHIQQEHSFCRGTSGTLWLLLYLQREGFIEVDATAISEELVQFLCKQSLQQLRAGEYDYMHQGLGATTALLCSPDYAKRHEKYLEEVVTILAATAQEEGDNAIYWQYPFREEVDASVSFGISHGLPGIISVLSKINRLNIHAALSSSLINKACTFLLRHRNPPGIVSLYPSLYGMEDDPSGGQSRLGWCYGDMGIAISFLHAAQATRNPAWFQEAHHIIDHLIQRPENEAPPHHDGSICHGDWGIAHIYHRLYQYRKDPALQALSARWFQYALAVTRLENEPAVLNADVNSNTWNDQADILNGIAGTGLVILSGLAPICTSWDEILFLDIPSPS